MKDIFVLSKNYIAIMMSLFSLKGKTPTFFPHYAYSTIRTPRFAGLGPKL